MLSLKERWAWVREGNLPFRIPPRPSRYYKDNGWVDYADFLGAEPPPPEGPDGRSDDRTGDEKD